MKRPEILSPAGDLERLKVAVSYGADAIYLGGPLFHLRQGATNFSKEDLKEGVSFAHNHGVNIYLTLNIFPHNKDLEDIPPYLEECQDLNLDGIIVSDPGLLSMVKEILPDTPIHLSTQANTTNYKSALFWQRQGISRLILARELSYLEIKEIAERTEVGLEVFVHGSLCLSYSGRCYLSTYLTGRDANKGECAQSCRWRYRLLEEKRPFEYYPIHEDERGTYILNSRDLSLINHLPILMELNLAAFKIEGRMKGIPYVAGVTKIYREARDAYLKDPESYQFSQEWTQELKKVSHREYTTGFFLGPMAREEQVPPFSSYIQEYRFLGLVKEYLPHANEIRLEVKNQLCQGERVEVFSPSRATHEIMIKGMRDEEGVAISQANRPQQIIYLEVDEEIEEYSLLRRREE